MVRHYQQRFLPAADHFHRLVVDSHALVPVQIRSQVVHHYLLLVTQLIQALIAQPVLLHHRAHLLQAVDDSVGVQVFADVVGVGQRQRVLRTEGNVVWLVDQI